MVEERGTNQRIKGDRSLAEPHDPLSPLNLRLYTVVRENWRRCVPAMSVASLLCCLDLLPDGATIPQGLGEFCAEVRGLAQPCADLRGRVRGGENACAAMYEGAESSVLLGVLIYSVINEWYS